MSRRKPKVFRATTAVKSAARELIGTPPPSRVEADPKKKHRPAKHKIRQYYDSLDDDEVEENRLWGQFAESQFPSE